MLATLVTALALLAPTGSREVAVALPRSELRLTLEAPGFRPDTALAKLLADEAGDNGVLAGTIDPPGTTLVVIVADDRPHRTSAQWRAELGQGQGEDFDSGGVACRELWQTLPDGSSSVHFNAYAVAGGFAFDVYARSAADASAPSLSRRDFGKLVESLRVAYARRGEPSNLPRDVRDAMHRAFCAWPGSGRAVQNEIARRPEDAALAFVAGELLLYTDASPELALAAHTRALALYSKLRTPSTEQRFAWMLSEEAIGAASCGVGKHAEGLEHLRKAFEIAGQLRSSARPEIAYEAARAATLAGSVDVAVQFLNEAISADNRWRAIARSDKQLGALASDKRFQALVR